VASTINSVPDGIIFTADSTGALNIQVNGINAIQVNTGGSLTVASQPTFNSPVPVSSGGTGLATTPTNGQLLVGNGSGYSLSTLTAGSGITVTNNAGSITITNTSTGGAQDFIVQSYGVV
jgi:hypothetical protein